MGSIRERGIMRQNNIRPDLTNQRRGRRGKAVDQRGRNGSELEAALAPDKARRKRRRPKDHRGRGQTYARENVA